MLTISETAIGRNYENGGITMKKKLSLKQIIIVLALSLVHLNIMADNVIIPVAGNLFQDFPEANINVFNFILSGSSLVGGVSCLVFGKLMDRFSKKKLMIVAFVIFMIGGIFGDLIHTAEYIAIMRALVGIGMGALNGIAVAIISDLFIDEELRSSAVGIFSAMQAAIGTILSYASGALAVNNWTTVFRIYLAAIPALIILLIIVPVTRLLYRFRRLRRPSRRRSTGRSSFPSTCPSLLSPLCTMHFSTSFLWSLPKRVLRILASSALQPLSSPSAASC
jgi:MFS family permease